MVTERANRRLTAILAADVAGYSRLMGSDEEGTLAALKAHRRALVDPKITEHRGHIVKTTGDGMLVEFASVIDAVRCAVDIQRGMIDRNVEVPQDQRIEFRMGIHQADIIFEDNDIFGDGVNVAARLEDLADPGGISVSGRVLEDIQGKIDVQFEDRGERHLRNIARPVRIYQLMVRESRPELSAKPLLALPDMPSIAVLQFQNMSGDPEQEYFADGVVEEMITALSRFKNLFVIARRSSFTYNARAVDVKEVGRELGVRYVLDGSVRKSANRIRITGQLVEASTRTHLWASRFDGALEDIFDLQDRMAEGVVGAIAPKLVQAEIARAKRKPINNLDAYDCYLRGLASIYWGTRESNTEALRLASRAIDLDPDFASAFGLAASCYIWRKANGWMIDPKQECMEAVRVAGRAAELGKDDASALEVAGMTLGYVAGNVSDGVALIDRALLLNPNCAEAWMNSGWMRSCLGQPELAIEHVARAMRLSPLDPFTGSMQAATALAHFLAERYDDAIPWAERAMQQLPNFVPAARIAAASYALSGRLEQARKVMARLRQTDRAFRMSTLKDHLPPLRPSDLSRYADGLRMAGLSE